MHTLLLLSLLLGSIDNPSIDMTAYLRVAQEAAAYREERRLNEEEFIRMSREPGTVVLDARSSEKFRALHVRGAVNLSFPDITAASLRALLPHRETRVLIYCNNNFLGDEQAFPTKIARASLNLSTFIALYSYGYRNVYELGPLLDVRTTKIELEGAEP
jgi:phage shock protein E